AAGMELHLGQQRVDPLQALADLRRLPRDRGGQRLHVPEGVAGEEVEEAILDLRQLLLLDALQDREVVVHTLERGRGVPGLRGPAAGELPHGGEAVLLGAGGAAWEVNQL